MSWEELLRQRGIDPDSLEAGQTIDLTDIPDNQEAGPKKWTSLFDSDAPQSRAERMFDEFWKQYGDPSFVMVPEYRFHPTRRWRADRAFPEQKVIVEIEGMFSKRQDHEGRHRSFSGFLADSEKYNAAALTGWIVYRIPSLWLYAGKHHRAQEVCAELTSLLRDRDELLNGANRENNRED